ncbi:MAG: hypothetical protein HOO98_12040 [Nitrospira sp.]|nr:hypothetical protein [Nitrospira sp.]
MGNPIESRPSQPFDEEAEVADFLPPEWALEGRATLSTDWRLAYLDQLHLTMEDPRFLAQSPTTQLLYLHLLKKTYGIGEREVAISIDQLVKETKLAWMTVQKQLKALTAIGLVTTTQPARQRVAPTYLVHWLPQLEQRADLKDIMTRYDQLDQEDLAELKRLAPLLSPSQREEMASEIHLSLRADGLLPSPELVTKILSYRLLHLFPYKHELMKKHPDWYDVPSQR